MKIFYSLICLFLFVHQAWTQEKLLYSTDFQDWTAITTTTSETTVTKTTDFSGESLSFKFFGTTVEPTKYDASRFVYPPASTGAAITQKNVSSYIELSPLNSITKIELVEGATGSNRGYQVWKKNASDLDWVSIYSTYASPASGQTVTLTINESNVAIKFTNLAIAQNGYMFSLKIWGNFTSAKTQMPLGTTVNIDAAGTITRTPNSDKYDKGTVVNLLATPNFGYKFVKWVDSTNVDISTANPYAITMDTTKKVQAIFAVANTYTYDVTVTGSKWGQVQLSPLPVNGKYEEGTQVSMKVIPNPVTNFNYWEDNSTGLERTITIDGNKLFTATFDEIPFIVGWNFKDQTVKQNRAGDFYSETTNTGLISAYEPDGTSVGWLINTGAFSPSYSCIRFWTAGSDFKTKHRYLKAQFSTIGYKNILLKSMVSANYQAYSVMVLQYSLNDTLYKELARVDISDVYNAGWKDLNATLPAEAEGNEKIFIRWKADDTSPILGEGTANNDGTAFTNIYVFADKIITEDHDAPALLSSVPVEGSATAPINGSVVLTFNEKVKVGTGNITLGSTVVTGNFGSKTVNFKYNRLNYNTQYKLIIPAGALTDLSGNPFGGDTITFKTSTRSEPVKKLFDAVVAKDGSGDYISIIDAITAAPSNSTAPWLIYVKNGKYTGHHDIPSSKPFIHLIGQYRDSVIISDNRLSGDAGDGTPVYNVSLGATMVVNSANCYFENITFENNWGYTKQAGPQALALYTTNDRIALKNCYLRSYQDTYLTSYNNVTDRHYLQNCKIEGAVDYIYGGGDVFFDNCTLNCMRKDGGYIVAPSHKTGTLWGYVFSNCTIDGAQGLTTYFGRPWQNAPKTVFLNTILKANVYPVGWYYKMGAIPAIFADYGTMDASGSPVDLSQRISNYEYDVKDGSGNVINTVKGTAKRSLTDTEAATYTYENVILRSGDTWDPRMIADAPDKPSNVYIDGSVITWTTVPYARLYIVFRNNTVIGFTTTPRFTDTNTESGKTYNYAVQAASEFGAISTTTEAIKAIKVKLTTSINIAAAGSLTKSPNNTDYATNSTVQLQATANANYRFVKWTDQSNNTISTENPVDIIMDADKTVIAVFEQTTGMATAKDALYAYGQNNTAVVCGPKSGSVISIYNLSGALVTSKVARSNKESFTLRRGFYLIKIGAEGSENVFKIVVE